MDTMAQRLAYALQKRDMKPPALIEATGLSKGAVYFILDGTTTPEKMRGSTVQKVCKALGIRPEWLLWKEGRMDAESVSRQPGTAPELTELRAIVTVVAQSLAASKRDVGRAMVAALAGLEGDLPQSTFATALKNTLIAELESQRSAQPPKRQAPKSRAGKPA